MPNRRAVALRVSSFMVKWLNASFALTGVAASTVAIVAATTRSDVFMAYSIKRFMVQRYYCLKPFRCTNGKFSLQLKRAQLSSSCEGVW